MEIQLTLSLPREALSIPVSRRVLADALRLVGVTEECVHDIAVALTEACTNVLDHAVDDEDYQVVAGIVGDRCTIDVVDRGAGFEPAAMGHSDAMPEAEGGRGIQLMRRLVDQVSFESRPKGGTVVHLHKMLEWREDAPVRPSVNG